MRVLVAPDSFKGTLSARHASAIIAAELASAGIECEQLPIADGGDGTLDLLLGHGFSAVEVDVVDAAGRPRRARIGRRADEAVIELAEVCGLVTVADLPLDGLHRTTLGLGLAARAAIEAGCRRITLAVGGSASVDGGLGLLVGLGFTVVDDSGAAVTPDLAGLASVRRIEPAALAPVEWRVLVDVSTPMAGRETSAMVFGAQKGLDGSQQRDGDAALRHWAAVLARAFGTDVREVPGGGAAGGVAAGAHAALGARLAPGAEAVLDLLDFDERLAGCDAVVTGEGSFDAQSLLGKGTGVVIEHARRLGRPAYVVAGISDVADPAEVGVRAIVSCTEPAGSGASARAEPAHWLSVAAGSLARILAAGARN